MLDKKGCYQQQIKLVPKRMFLSGSEICRLELLTILFPLLLHVPLLFETCFILTHQLHQLSKAVATKIFSSAVC